MWSVVILGIVTIILLFGILLMWKINKDSKSGFPMRDERTSKITGRAATYALYIGSFFITAFLFILMIGKEFYDLPEIAAGYPLIASLLVYNLAFLVLRLYFERKGKQ
jgi:hypothetical protein